MVEQQIRQRDAIVEYLAEHGDASVDDIAGAVGMSRPIARQRVRDAVAVGVVQRVGASGGVLVYRAASGVPVIRSQPPAPTVDSRESDGGRLPDMPQSVYPPDATPLDTPELDDQDEPDPEPAVTVDASAGFDPAEHGVREIKAYLADVDGDERARVIDLERHGKERKSVLDLA